MNTRYTTIIILHSFYLAHVDWNYFRTSTHYAVSVRPRHGFRLQRILLCLFLKAGAGVLKSGSFIFSMQALRSSQVATPWTYDCKKFTRIISYMYNVYVTGQFTHVPLLSYLAGKGIVMILYYHTHTHNQLVSKTRGSTIIYLSYVRNPVWEVGKTTCLVWICVHYCQTSYLKKVSVQSDATFATPPALSLPFYR